MFIRSILRRILRFVLQNIENAVGRRDDGWPNSALLTAMSGVLLGAADGQTTPASAVPLKWFSDPVAGARCLGRRRLWSIEPKGAVCVAEPAIKATPSALKARGAGFVA